MYRVIKRDGAKAEFDIHKIVVAITKAFEAQEKQYHPQRDDMLALKVTSDFENKIKDGLVAVEDIQDSVSRCSFRRVTRTSPKHTYCTADREKRSAT